MSQSLLHQVTYSDDMKEEKRKGGIDWPSQSLLHQVTYSDYAYKKGLPILKVSQSLLHQVTYSDKRGKYLS